MPGGAITVIDEAYNASPASMRAAIAVLGAMQPGPGGRRIAVLGDMLELGPQSPGMHAGLAPTLEEAGVDLVFASGPDMARLIDALPEARRGLHAVASGGLFNDTGSVGLSGSLIVFNQPNNCVGFAAPGCVPF